MVNIWIYQKDKQAYISAMEIGCNSGPSIKEETEDKLKVDFCQAAMQLWVQSGHWFGSE
jgi:hypothetical protein